MSALRSGGEIQQTNWDTHYQFSIKNLLSKKQTSSGKNLKMKTLAGQKPAETQK